MSMKSKNPIKALVAGYLSSDDEENESDTEGEMKKEVDLFLKEVDGLNISGRVNSETDSISNNNEKMYPVIPSTSWQECYDQSSGYTYYWNTETNETTWDIPSEYENYLAAVKESWNKYNEASLSAFEKAKQQLPNEIKNSISQPTCHMDTVPLIRSVKPTSAPVVPEYLKPESVSVGKKLLLTKSDSEDEKIELITSYGPNSDHSSSEDKILTNKSLNKHLKKKRKKVDRTPSQSIVGPELPKNITVVGSKTELVPYHPEMDDSDNDEELNKNNEKVSSSKVTEQNDDETELKKLEEVKHKIEIELNSIQDDEFSNDAADRISISSKSNEKIMRDESNADTEEDEEEKERRKNIVVADDVNPAKSKSDQISSSESCSDDTVASDCSVNQKKCNNLITEEASLTENNETINNGNRKRKLKIELPDSSHINPKIKHIEEDSNEQLVVNDSQEEKLTTEKKDENSKPIFPKVAFVKSSSPVINSESETESKNVKEFKNPDDILQITDAAQVLMDKMNFLSEGKERVSAVQIWYIQLETLMKAWEGSHLKSDFLKHWLSRMSDDLQGLERNVAPDGWLCQWQRIEKRYSYKNIKTGQVVWNFPQSKTEPVKENQVTILNVDSEESNNRLITESDNDNNTDPGVMNQDLIGEEEMDLCDSPQAPSTPPPPSISSPVPSPPSPPKIINFNGAGKSPPLPPLPPNENPPLPPKVPLDEQTNIEEKHFVKTPHEPLPPGVDEYNHMSSNLLHNSSIPSTQSQISVVHQTAYGISPQVAFHHHPHSTLMQGLHYGPYMTPLNSIPSTTICAGPASTQLQQTLEPQTSNKDMLQELDSFYTDLATIETDETHTSSENSNTPPLQPVSTDSQITINPEHNATSEIGKKKKKAKLGPGLALKKKGVSDLVAKWQKVQKDVQRDLKTFERD